MAVVKPTNQDDFQLGWRGLRKTARGHLEHENDEHFTMQGLSFVFYCVLI